MANIELFVGNATTRGQGSLNVVALYKRTAKDKQVPVTFAVKDEKSGVKSLNLVDIKNSSTGNRPGLWIKTRVELPEGSFIEFQMMRSGGLQFGGLNAFIIRSRQDGPFWRIGINLPCDDKSTESRGYIEGRFDVLRIKDIVELGVASHKDIHTYDPRDYQDNVTFELVEREMRARPIIAARPIKPTVVKSGSSGKSVLKIRRIRRIGAS